MSDTRVDRKSKRVAHLQDELLWLGVHYEDLPGEAVLTEMRVRVPKNEDGDWMVIVKAWVAGTQSVAFLTAPDLDAVMHLVAAKLANGTMEWKVDKPYGQLN